MTRTWQDVTEDELRSWQARPGYQEKYLAEDLRAQTERLHQAQEKLAEAERDRLVVAMLAVRAGRKKITVAAELGVTRPTLDAWLKATTGDEDLMRRVRRHEYFLRREIARGKTKGFEAQDEQHDGTTMGA